MKLATPMRLSENLRHLCVGSFQLTLSRQTLTPNSGPPYKYRAGRVASRHLARPDMAIGAKNLLGFCCGAVIVMCLHTLSERSSAGPPQRTVRLLAADSLTADAGDDATLLSAVRAQASEVRSLISRTEQMERTLSDMLEDSKNGVSSSESSTSTSSARAGRTCPAGCTRHGNCDELSGQCACPPTYTGTACDVPTMPACSTRVRHGRRRGRRRGGVDGGGTSGGGDGTEEEDESFVNLSGIASENFWWMMRDVKPKPSEDPRRASPPFRWVGLVTCECVRQSIAFLSLASSAEPAPWPRYIGHTELSMVRACAAFAGKSGLVSSKVGLPRSVASLPSAAIGSTPWSRA